MAPVTIVNNDRVENPFDFAIWGRGTMPFYLPLIIDNTGGGSFEKKKNTAKPRTTQRKKLIADG